MPKFKVTLSKPTKRKNKEYVEELKTITAKDMIEAQNKVEKMFKGSYSIRKL